MNQEFTMKSVTPIRHLLAEVLLSKAIPVFILMSVLLMPQFASAQSFFNHTPVALPDRGNNSTDGGNIFYVSPSGIQQAHFDAATGNWNTVTSYANGTGFDPKTWDPSLIGLSWWLNSKSWEKVNLFINQGNSSNKVLENYMWRDPVPSMWNYRNSTWTQPSMPMGSDFYPKTAFEHSEALNYFGTDEPGHVPYLPAPAGTTPARRLKEFFWNTQRWFYTYWGNPVSDSDPAPILLGPQGAAFYNRVNPDYVNPAFAGVAITYQRPARAPSTPQQPEIAVFVHENDRWRWEKLKNPLHNPDNPPGVTLLRAPVVIMREYYSNCSDVGSQWITFCDRVRRPIILVVGLNSAMNKWEIYSTERKDSPSGPLSNEYPGSENWGEWKLIGAPPDLIQNIDPNTGLPLGFNLTAYVNYEHPVTSGPRSYRDTAASNNVVRIGPRYNIFGNADSGDVAPELISDDRGNFSWGSGFKSPVTGSRMKLNSAMVTRFPNDPARYRLSVPVRLDNDQIWEYSWDSSVHVWTWTQL